MFNVTQTREAVFHGFVPTARDLENMVEYWHTHDTGSSLGDFLGISREEYQLWLTKGDDALLDAFRRRKAVSAGEAAIRMSSSLQ